MKICRVCFVEKSLNDFEPKRRKCRDCRGAERQNFYQNNKEEMRAKSRAKHFENRERNNARSKSYRLNNLEKFKAYQQTRLQVRGQLVWDFLKTNSCEECCESNPVVLEFDHFRGEKKIAVSAATSHSLKSLANEIAKCRVLCCNCHKKRTAIQLNRRAWMGKTAAEDDLGTTTLSRKQRTHLRKLYDFLSSNPCKDCGENNPVVLEFDHVRGEKFKCVSHLTNYSWDVISAEVAKCEVRCGNCHKIKTAKESNFYAHCC